jgi:hypothetical protein
MQLQLTSENYGTIDKQFQLFTLLGFSLFLFFFRAISRFAYAGNQITLIFARNAGNFWIAKVYPLSSNL